MINEIYNFEDFINENLFKSVEVSPHVKKVFNIPELDFNIFNIPSVNQQLNSVPTINYSIPILNTQFQTEEKLYDNLRAYNVVQNTRRRSVEQKPIKGIQAFEEYYNEVELEMPEAKKYRKILTAIAKNESGFDPEMQNQSGAPAWGYFLFMQGNYRGVNHNNVKQFSGLKVKDFLKNPKEQIKAAVKLAKQFDNSLTAEDKRKILQKGLTYAQTMYGMWFAGLGGLRKYLDTNSNLTDGVGGSLEKVLKAMENV